MFLVYILCLSALAGWAVNLIADTVPKGLPLRLNWYLPFRWFMRPRPVESDDRATVVEMTQNLFWRHIVVWVLTFYLGSVAYLASDSFAHALVLSVQAWCFLTIAVIDIEHRLVLNRVLLWMLPVIFLCNTIAGLPSFSSSVLGGAAGFALFLALAIAWPGGMGMGDVKLAGVIGLATGISGVLVALFIGILSGGIAAIAILLFTRMRNNATMAYAPYLVFGAWIALYGGSSFWYM
ncbi:MAG: A24 family peptidase [Caldilineaceae bacterium]